MTAVFDTSRLCYLILLEETEWLPRLFSRLLVPTAVVSELSASGAPRPVAQWISLPPPWLEVLDAPAEGTKDSLQVLDEGERAAIELALHVGADWTILDEKAARKAAKELRLPVMGLLGLLTAAADKGWIDFGEMLVRLQTTSFRASASLLRSVLRRYRSLH